MRDLKPYSCIHNLPILYPDETLYSWCGTVHSWNPCVSVLETSFQLFQKYYAGLLHDFPAHLDTLHKTTKGLLAPNPEILALEHSLFGYFLPWIPNEKSRRILWAAVHENNSHVKYHMGIPASRVGGLHPLKFCYACIKEDEDRFGRPFWHVQHQNPSTFICLKHQLPLSTVKHDRTPVHERRWLLPSQITALQSESLKIISTRKLEKLYKLATIASHVLHLEIGYLTGERLAQTYQYALQNQGCLTNGGSVKGKSLTNLIVAYYGSLLPLLSSKVKINFDDGITEMASKLARHTPRPGHPFKHCLLISALFDTWEDFISNFEKTTSFPKIKNQLNTQLHNLNAEKNKQKILRYMIDKGLSATQTAYAFGISTTTVLQMAKAAGIKISIRPKRIKGHLKATVESMLANGTEKHKICKDTKVSIVTINRMLAASPQLAKLRTEKLITSEATIRRKRFQLLIKQNRNVPLKRIRKIPENDFTWLYRHDNDWLKALLKSHGVKRH